MHRGLWLSPKLLTPGRVVTAGAAATAAAAIHNRDRLQDLRLSWNSTVIEGVSGAAGEVAQIALVYPLDTVKVRAQAWGWSSRKVIADLLSSTGGSPTALLAALYAGAVPAALLSVLVGSVHYISFCTTRRALIKLESMGGSRDSSSNSSSAGRPQTAVDSESQQHMIVSHGMTGTHFLLEEEQPVPRTNSSSSSSSSSNEDFSSREHSSSSSSSSHAEASLRVNILSAVITAAITALVEAPLELFRHNCQAGQIQGSFVRAMWRTLRRSGPRSLYLGFLPYCLESWPYDTTELLVIGAGRDARHLAPDLAPAAYDMALGGLAGGLAVLVSQPFDTVKTYIQCAGADAAVGSGLAGNAAAFWRTGQQLVARGGPGSLFVGLVPRLVHQVPGAMVCWLVIEGCQRFLLQAAARAEQVAGDSAENKRQQQQ